MDKQLENHSSLKEYKEFLKNYLFPLLGIPDENNLELCSDNIENETQSKPIFQKNGYLYFCNNKKPLFKLSYEREFGEDNINLCLNIIQTFFKVSKYKMDVIGSSLNHNYYSDIQLNANYKMAIQKGLCNWIVKKNNPNVEKLFEILEKWSVQTYEGKKVSFGFIINPNVHSSFGEKFGTWCDFLEQDYAAVFTDCIHSVIELDSDCNFYRYLSVSENNHLDAYDLKYNTAHRFSMVMQKYVTNDCVGVFLLTNGDIILSKNGAIKFVKRNLKWLNFSYDSFKNSFGDFFIKHQIQEDLLKDIFASMLDVSFSHTGGIIALTTNIDALIQEKNDKEPILDCCDFLASKKTLGELANILKHKKVNPREINKKLLKRKVLTSLIKNNSFSTLDRKLRCELISLDGACILDAFGNVCASGAIIKNDSGSTGGGRGAATKKLSKYGFAIKISTDGYIELYINGYKRYSIK